jgi:C-terminal processing protease CtpA/Prc
MAKAASSPEMNIKVGYGKIEQKNRAGIGIELDIKGSEPMAGLIVKSFTINRVFKSSSADEAGIIAGDQIISIDKIRVEGSNINTLLSVMDKPAGDNVNVVIKRLDGSQEKFTLEINETKQR